MDALADLAPIISHRGSVVQARMSCARVLVNRLDYPQPVRTSSADVDVANEQCAAVSISRLRGDVEQPVRVGWCGRFGGTQDQGYSWVQRCT